MKHMKEPKEHKPMSKGAKIGLCVGGVFVIAGIVFGTLWLLKPNYNWQEAKNYTDEILGTRDALKNYFNTTVDKVELDDKKVELFEKYKSANQKLGDYMESLSASTSLKNEDAKALFDKANSQLENVKKVYEVEEKLYAASEDGEYSDDELEDFAKSGSDFLKNMSKDLKGYRKEVADFMSKYEDVSKAKKAELDEDYAVVQEKGDKLSKKYEKINFEDMYQMSSDDLFAFYDTIEELNKLFAEKI